MNTSARNQISGKIAKIVEGAVNAEIEIAIAAGQAIVAQITLPSVKSLGLVEGKTVIALFKSSWVVLGAGEEAPRVSARNKLQGKVTSIVKGAVNSEVILDIGGESIVSTITNESVSSLGLDTGSKAWALIKASSVIVAV